MTGWFAAARCLSAREHSLTRTEKRNRGEKVEKLRGTSGRAGETKRGRVDGH